MNFVTGKTAVYKKISELMNGDDGVFVVAYIGMNMTSLLSKKSKARIVCDVAKFTSCHPREVKEMIDSGHHVKKYKNLHAKVFVSSLGAFVGSKNMTDAESYEAGMFYEQGSTEFIAISKWAESFFEKKGSKISASEIATLIVKREIADIGKLFHAKKSKSKSKKDKNDNVEKVQDMFSSIPSFGGIAFWINDFDAKKEDCSIESKPNDIITVKQWYKENSLDESTVFQDEYSKSYLKIIKPFMHKNYISVEVKEKNKNPVGKITEIINPFSIKRFKSTKEKKYSYFLTGYTSKPISEKYASTKVQELLNGIWKSKSPSFKKWQKSEPAKYWWMDSRTLELCIKEYLLGKDH